MSKTSLSTKEWTSPFPKQILTSKWALIQWVVYLLSMMRSGTSFKERWLKRLLASAAKLSHLNLRSAKDATNCSVRIVRSIT